MQKKYSNTEVWTDASGSPITTERIAKYDRVLYGNVKKFFPARACYEASMALADLVNQGRLEIAGALQRFDPNLALNSVSQVSDRKKMTDEEHLAWKRSNPDQALAERERVWVTTALINWLRRTRHKYSESVRGGKAVAYAAVLAKNNTAVDENGADAGSLFGIRSEAGIGSATEDQLSAGVEDMETTRRDYSDLIDIMTKRRRGVSKERAEEDAIKNIAERFRQLSPERQADLVEFLRYRSETVNIFDETG